MAGKFVLDCVKCTRIKWELSETTMFGLEQPNDGEFIDVEKSFARRDRGIVTLAIRLFFLSWSFSAFAAQIIKYPVENRFIFLGYFSHLTWCVVILYQFCILVLTLFRARCNCLKQPPEGDPPSFLVRFTWILYSLAGTTTIILNFVFYFPSLMDYFHKTMNPFLKFFEHTILCALVLIDGAILSRIPVKLKHFRIVFFFILFYFIWSIIHDFSGMGNGTWPDERDYQSVGDDGSNSTSVNNSSLNNSRFLDADKNTSSTNNTDQNNDKPGDDIRFFEDALYPALSWKYKPGLTSFFYLSMQFLVSPCCFFFLWMLSLKPRPIYGGPLNDLGMA